MKSSVLLLSSMFVATSMFASADLLKEAKDYGLIPLPSDQKGVEAILKDIGVKPNVFTAEKVILGKQLYFDPRLSKSGIISCNTCHNLGLGGTDGVSAAIGNRWTQNPHHLNSPTVYNSVLNTTQFWDGRAKTLVDQAKGPIESDAEMATPAKLAVEKISSLPEYVMEFKKIYGKEGVTFNNIADSIAVFERTLLTPSRFDKFLKGDTNALTKAEKAGLRLFLDKGCVACHNGVNLGGSMQPFQVAGKYKFANIGDFKGDANGMVKTPTLRNIALTAPYFHNGAVWSLEDAIKTMGSVQLGIDINDTEAKSIATFLDSLTGKMPKVIYPMFPRSTDKTPKPVL